jgi:putative flippase GtrA
VVRDGLRSRAVGLLHELTKFGIVGAAGMVVDLGVANLLRWTVLEHKPLTCRLISLVLATLVTYFGNRHWTWKDRLRRSFGHEYAVFFALNAVGLVLNLAVLALVTYGLDLTGPLWYNVANLIGIGLGTLFRFWSYRRFVFRTGDHRNEDAWDETAHTTV